MEFLGIDVGGSSIKAGVVDVRAGKIQSEIAAIATPKPSTPEQVMKAVAELGKKLPSKGAVGFAFPTVVQAGKARTAAHVDPSWVDAEGAKLVQATLGRPCAFLNDAAAAGLAEMEFGAGRNTQGSVIMLTFGTGIGTALFMDGQLFPNTELGHLEFDGMEAEARASGRARMERKLDWSSYMNELNYVINSIHALFWPDLIVLCGGITADNPNLTDDLKARVPLKVGALRADAGIVGAAFATTLAQGVWIKPAKAAAK